MFGVLLIATWGLAAEVDQVELESRASVERSLPFLARDGNRWRKERGCVSCHHVPFMIWAHNEASVRGIAIDRSKINEMTNWAFVNMLAERDEVGGADTISQMLLGRDRHSDWRRKPPRHFKTVDPYETLFEILLERQNEDGSWPPEGQLTTPPELTTRWALLALDSRNDDPADPGIGLDLDKDLGTEIGRLLPRLEERIPVARSRAEKYLQAVKPHATNEGLVLRALLEWITDEGDRDTYRAKLLANQKTDGGWSNRFDFSESDAFATGQSIYALARIGNPDDHQAIARARDFLIHSQNKDGSWEVVADRVRDAKRSASLDEVFSYWGTAWATIGLLHTLDEAGN